MILRKVYINRDPVSADGLFGTLRAGLLELYTLENPTLFIPAGSYKVMWMPAEANPKHGACYEVQKVAGRTDILIHPANWHDQLLGCIALGRAIMDIVRPDGTKMRGVSSSQDAVAAFNAEMGRASFELVIFGKTKAGEVGVSQA
jgi:hypothetical protein